MIQTRKMPIIQTMNKHHPMEDVMDHVVDIERRKNQSPASTNTRRSNRDQYFQPMGSKEKEKGARDTHK